MLSELIAVKRKLLDKQKQYDKQYEQYTDDEYKQGILSGLTVALHSIDELLESESDRMARDYGEDKD